MTHPHSDLSHDLPAALAATLSSRAPGPPLPPGPRANSWGRAGAVAAESSPGLAALLDALWHPGELHRAADDRQTGIPRRPVPSAGACYPVQTHVVDRDGTRWAFDHEQGVLRRRETEADREAGWPSAPKHRRAAQLVFTVQPGRSFGRYRHRAWPLWIADAAYAVAAARFALGARSTTIERGPSDRLRALLGMPRAAETEAWLRRGLAPEIPLAALDIADDPTPLPDAHRALRTRRSPSLQEFTSRSDAVRPVPEAESLARTSGQAWVRGASAVASWSIATSTPAHALAAALWDAHLAAADLCYAAALSGAHGARPISGFPAEDGRWTLHAVAFLAHPGGS